MTICFNSARRESSKGMVEPPAERVSLPIPLQRNSGGISHIEKLRDDKMSNQVSQGLQ